jgi:hypothetical protein
MGSFTVIVHQKSLITLNITTIIEITYYPSVKFNIENLLVYSFTIIGSNINKAQISDMFERGRMNSIIRMFKILTLRK